MTDEKMQTNESNQPEQAKPKPTQERQQTPKPQAGVATQPGQRMTPGRKPLFRTEVVSGRG